MKLKECFKLGFLKRTHGTDGTLLLQLSTVLPDKNLLKEPVFIPIHKSDEYPVPFFVDKIEKSGKRSVHIRFEEAQSMEKAQRLVSKDLYLPHSFLPESEIKENPDLNILINFRVIDNNAGDLGVISEIIQNPVQSLFKVVRNGEEILIPAVEEMIIEIDPEQKVVKTDLPEGLTDINA